MKTTNNVQKTENKKFENPVSKTFAVVISLVLISLTVSANGFWKQLLVNNTFGKMAILMVDQENKNQENFVYAVPANNAANAEANSASSAFVIETTKENILGIESWMTDLTYFGSNVFPDQVSKFESLEIEDWMITNPNIGGTAVSNESEPSLELEAWMIDENIWAN